MRKPGSESRHNLTYWRYGDYVGIGPGAHGRLTLEGRKLRRRQHRGTGTLAGDGGRAGPRHAPT